MERTVSRRVPPVRPYRFIATSDWHIRDDIPACRERNEYRKAQEAKLAFIQNLCVKNEAVLIHAGDLFDHWKPSPWLISLVLHYLPPETIVVPGQHDLPEHNLQELEKTGLQTLQEARRVFILSGGLRRALGRSGAFYGSVYGYAFGEEAQNPPKETKYPQGGVKLLIWHRLTCAGRQPWPGANAEVAPALKKRLSGYDIIVTGDNHQQFDASAWLINPGSMMRMASDQVEHEPAVYGWRDDGSVTRIPLPIKKGAVKATASNPKVKESRDKRMEAYITRATKQFEDRLSFDKNLERYFKTNKERKEVETITWKAAENEKQ